MRFDYLQGNELYEAILEYSNISLAFISGESLIGEILKRRYRILPLLKPRDINPDFLGLIVSLFLPAATKRTTERYWEIMFWSDPIAVYALSHPGCPEDNLAAACHSDNIHYANIASRNANCPESDAVYAQLRMTGEYERLSPDEKWTSGEILWGREDEPSVDNRAWANADQVKVSLLYGTS